MSHPNMSAGEPANASKPYAPAVTNSPSTESQTRKATSTANTSMLSMDFTVPLAGEQRTEAIQQMTQRHPAIEKSHAIQGIIYKAQTSLRRMPGVSSAESNEIIDQLQEVGQIVNLETTHLVQALKGMELDAKSTEGAIQRMSLEATFLKAKVDNQEGQRAELAGKIDSLKADLSKEKHRRMGAEKEANQILDLLMSISTDFKVFKEKILSNGLGTNPNDLIKGIERILSHIEIQVNTPRSHLAQDDTESNALALVPVHSSEAIPAKKLPHEKKPLKKIDSTWRSTPDGLKIQGNEIIRSLSMQELACTPHMYQQQIGHAQTPLQSRFETLQLGGPYLSHDQGYQRGPPYGQVWGLANGDSRPQSRSASMSRQTFHGAFNSGTNSRPSSRKSYHEKGKYRANSNAPEFYPAQASAFTPVNSRPPSRVNTSFGFHGNESLIPPPLTPKHHQSRPSRLIQQIGYDGNGYNGHVVHITDHAVAAWSSQIGGLYGSIRGFVDQYAGKPVTNAQELVNNPIWQTLIQTYTPLSPQEAGSYLNFHIRDTTSKLCLVTRVIVDYFVNCIWTPEAWKGANPESTAALVELKDNFDKVKYQPSNIKQPLLDRQAMLVDNIMKYKEPGCEFHRAKLEEMTTILLNNLEPLLNNPSQYSDAYNSLLQVANQAWDLSSKILTSRLSFDYRFPEVGSRFSRQSMNPVWPTDVSITDLQIRHWRVAMSTTPVITIRNDTGTNISAHCVANADVICMQ